MRIAVAIFVLSCCASAQTTLFRVQKFCEVGGQTVNVQGLNSTTHVQRSFPRCTVEVFLTGTTTHPSNIYSDNLSTPTPLANPFTANTDGSFGFYAAITACYDIVTSGGNTGDQFPSPFTYTNICSGGTGGGGPGITPGTPFQIPRYDATGTNIQDSTGSDNPANGPTRWPSGITVVNNAGYRQFNNSPSGTSANLSVCIDTSVTSTQQVKTCAAGSSNAIGIADSGGTSGNVQVAMIGFHAAVFTGQTVINDYFGPSATVDGQFDDLGASRPTGVEVMGHVTSLNSGSGTLATVDLFTGDTIAPGATGGSGTVSNSGCANANAYYATTGTVVSADCLFTDDGAGNPTAVSLGLTGLNAGFLFQKQGTAPTLSAANSVYVHPPTSVASTIGLVWPGTLPVTGNCVEWLAVGGERQFGDSGSPCGSGGSGSVTSVSQVSPNGVLSQSGGPITVSGTFTWVWSATSGGLLCFTGASQAASSGLLSSNNPIIGGGSGACPTSGSRSGNTTTFGTTSGSLISGNCIKSDASGNLIDAGTTCGSSGTVTLTARYLNSTSAGTATNVPVRWETAGINEQHVVQTSSADFHQGWFDGIIGICTSGCGNSGSSIVQFRGTVNCQFEGGNPITGGDFVEIGNTGKCLDNGGAGVNENPELHNFFAKVNPACNAGCTMNTVQLIDLIPVQSFTKNQSSDNPTTPLPNYFATIAPGQQFPTISPFRMETFNGGRAHGAAYASGQYPAMATDSGYRAYDQQNAGAFYDIYFTWNGFPSYKRGLLINTAGGANNTSTDASLRIGCEPSGTNCTNTDGTAGTGASMYSEADVSTIGGTFSIFDPLADSHWWTLNADLVFVNVFDMAPGRIVRWTICQPASFGGGGPFKVTWPAQYVNPPTVTALAGDCTSAQFLDLQAGTNGGAQTAKAQYQGSGASARVVKTSQVAGISSTVVAQPTANSTYRVVATLSCDSSSAAATVNVTIGWTDPSNTAQTATLGSAVVCTTLGSASVGQLSTAFRAKSGTNITYSTAIVNTPTYDVTVNLETLTAN